VTVTAAAQFHVLHRDTTVLVCETCGTLVPYTEKQTHIKYHEEKGDYDE
jgi:hypothetical protein